MTNSVLDRTDLGTSWEAVRAEFALDRSWTHLGTSQFFASHPRPVREAIERHRRALDANPVLYIEEHEYSYMQQVREAAADYFGASDANEFALTDSTTMGLGLLYTALPLRAGDEVVTTDHEHYSHRDALGSVRDRAGIRVHPVRLYDGLAADVEAGTLVERIMGAVTAATRVVAVTWVQSDTGLKLPVADLARALARVNAAREEDARALLCVDGTHGVGIETDTVHDLGCDVLVGDTHKWLYGPRGTGFMWAPIPLWRRMRRVIPSFTEAMDAFSDGEEAPPMDGRQFTPGGFHSLEHRWAATEAFAFHARIGKERVAARVRELARQCKEGLAAMPHVTLHTPMRDELSAGIVAFEVRGMSSDDAMQALRKRRIIATVAPYQSALLRFTPGIINTADDVEAGLAAVRALAR
jgi:isopenicillin-N epimerase